MMKRDIIVIAHNIRSLHNVGAIFRTADAFGVKKIYLTGYTGTPPRQEIAKVSLGAENVVPWEYYKQPTSVIKQLKREGVRIVACEQTPSSISLPDFHIPDRVAIILGNEVRGVSKTLCQQADQIVSIPMFGKKESLNVSVACGVALYALRFQ